MSGVPASSTRARQRRPAVPGVAATLRDAGISLARTVRGGLVRGWRALAPFREGVGTVGRVVLVAIIVFLVVGFVFGWAEFVYLGLTLAAAMLLAAVFLLGRADYSVTVELRPHRVVVGDRALGSLTATNRLPRRAGASVMELPVGRGIAEFAIPQLEVDQSHEELFAVPTHRRAVILAGPAMTVRGDRLGLLRRVMRWTEPVELFVHPRTARLASSAAGLVRDLEGEETRTITDNDISFHALRPYQQGDALRNVHWRTSARVGQLMVRQYQETRRSELLLALGTEQTAYASDEEFELAVSIFASLGIQVIDDATAITAMTEESRLRSVTRQALLDDSCRIEQTDRRYGSLRDFLRAAKRITPRPSVALLVAGSGSSVTQLRTGFTVFGQETQRMVVRAALGQPPSIAVVSGIMVATVGDLADLGAVMRKVRP